MVLRCIAVDDEPLALALVCSFIEQTPFLQLIGRFDNAIDALKSVHDQAPDLVFLDIQMSDLTGIELARILDGDASGHRTRIIFTTAYNQFALESYKVDALDYLLKPFNYEEFLRAASKGRHYFELLKKGPEPQVHDPGYIFLKVEYQLVKVAFDDIRYIEGLKDYVKVHLAGTKRPLLSLTSLKSLEEKLPGHTFIRIHRSYIVSIDKIDAISKSTVQIGEATLTISDNYKEAFQKMVGRWSG